MEAGEGKSVRCAARGCETVNANGDYMCPEHLKLLSEQLRGDVLAFCRAGEENTPMYRGSSFSAQFAIIHHQNAEKRRAEAVEPAPVADAWQHLRVR